MPQANNNTQQVPNKRFGIIATPKKDMVNGFDFIDITLITDENVSKILADWTNKNGNHPFKLGSSNKSVTFRIRKGDENVFVQKNMYRAIEAAMKYNGFNITPESFLNSLRNANEHDYPTKEELASVDTSFDAMMNSMFDQFEKKIDDPAVQRLLENMHMVDPMTGEFKNAADLLKAGQLSAKNVVSALGQWRNNGRGGVPTFVATANEWRDYNRYVVNGATRLFIYTPNSSPNMSRREVAQKFNVPLNQIRGNAHLTHAANTHHMNHGDASNALEGFHFEVFYDVSDTEVIPGMDDLFNEHAGLESNLWRDKWNKKAIENGEYGTTSDVDKQAVFDAGFSNNENNAQIIVNGLNMWCTQNPVVGDEVKKMLDNNNLVGAVRKYFETDAFFDNNKELSDKEKNAFLNICVFSVLNYYGVAPDEMLRAYQLSKDYLMQNKKIKKKIKIALMPFFSNFIKMINNNNKQTVANECKEVESKFRNLWNRMVEADEKNRNANIF